jgi:hypothetical protein
MSNMNLTKKEYARELKIKEVEEGLEDESVFEMSYTQCISCGYWLSNEEDERGLDRCEHCYELELQ